MEYTDITTKFRKFFELPTSPVAVKIVAKDVENEKNVKNADTKEIESPMRYCEMVRRCAVLGESFTLDIEDLSCASAELALGFTEPSYGEVYPRIKPANTAKVMLAPLEKATFVPDVVVVVSNPRKIMRMTTIMAHLTDREPVSAKFKGEFAVCGECTAIPYMENKPNLSLLCNGARMFGGYRDEEISFGFPLADFVKVADATEQNEITSALCGCIMDALPAQVVDALAEIGFGKGTDQFFGRFDGDIVRLYTTKDDKGKISSVALHIPVKFATKEEAEDAFDAARGIVAESTLVGLRDNWVDMAIIVEFGESINRAAMRGDKFTAFIQDGIKVIKEEAGKFKRKWGVE